MCMYHINTQALQVIHLSPFASPETPISYILPLSSLDARMSCQAYGNRGECMTTAKH